MRTKLESLTAREREEMTFYSEERQLEREHELKVKELDVELEKESIKWQQLLKIPKLIILLPILPFIVFILIVDAFKEQVSDDRIINIFK